jgi:hypothetical protein
LVPETNNLYAGMSKRQMTAQLRHSAADGAESPAYIRE